MTQKETRAISVYLHEDVIDGIGEIVKSINEKSKTGKKISRQDFIGGVILGCPEVKNYLKTL